ncbi:FtsX-like permease family protein [Streptococcus plurextorum]|uniref:FtsX-like permease family protein n=1 Tax=Streptococcus plurextorum TaxID=456876 RepID=UPI00040FDD72|nr:ABC transporter permease [Streptococcus plurextorum]
MFYLKLAWNNIRASKKAYAPFLLASFVLYCLSNAIMLIMFSPMTEDMKKAVYILPLGIVVLAIMSIVMEIYSYNVLLKQRTKEFGLYNILGMNKAQIGWISTLELGMVYLLLIVLGTVFSGIFANFLYLVFVNIVNYDQLLLTLSPLAFILNALLFGVIFLILEVYGLRFIRKTSPLDLFRSSEKGEKEPRGNLILALLSLLCLGTGYGISLISGKLKAIELILYFFGAVVLVIIGTYLFYISFMAWYLKKKRSNTAYYYQPKHFITISQMIFRMKAHAAGLASITLLSVMAFVSIGTTTALYVNTHAQAERNFLMNTRIATDVTAFKEAASQAETYLHHKLGDDKQLIAYTTFILPMSLTDDSHLVGTAEDLLQPDVDTGYVYLISQEDFRALGNDIPNLVENQVLFYNQTGDSNYKTVTLNSTYFQVIENLTEAKMPDVQETYNGAVMVVASEQIADTIVSEFQELVKEQITFAPTKHTIYLDLTDKEMKALGLDNNVALHDADGNYLGWVSTKQAYFDDSYKIFGGMLFTGVLLGISFLLGAALIIYYKQYSEGQEDKKSYKILQEVGMAKEAVKKTIASQTLLVFFMPLAVAVLHYTVAIPMLKKMLFLFGVQDNYLIYIVAAGTTLAVALIYFAIYKLTSRTYYKIVER